MTHLTPAEDPSAGADAPEDLGQRVARYRARLIAEGRMNSVRHLDRSVAQPRPDVAPGKGLR